jgi:DNA-binding LytR/AlgR family response regulator
MSRDVCFQAPYLSVEYDERRFLYANWKGYVSVGQVKEGVEKILEALQRYACSRLVNDNRELFGTWTQSIRWLEMDFMPRMIAAGLEKIAFIYSRDPSARYSVDRFLEVNDQYSAQTFDDYRTAEDWLLEVVDPQELRPEYPDVLAVRDHDRHLLIPFGDIYYMMSEKGETVIHTRKQIYTTRVPIKDLVAKLPSEQFVQTHRSYVINLHEVATLKYYAGGAYHACLKELPKIRIPVSRQHAGELKARLGIGPS